jgi:SHS2 domain-containing protein
VVRETTEGQQGHRQVDHTADLALELWAPTEEDLLIEGARAVVDIMTEGAAIGAEARRHVVIDAVDPQDRLVQWLNEIIYAAVVDGFLFAAADRLTLAGGQLEAELVGEAGALQRVAGELKSATYHDLALDQRDGRWQARVVIDV